VSYSPALRWLVALLLPMTLAWKLGVGPEDPNALKEKIVQFLVRHQFDVVISEEIVEDMPAIRASSEGCRMLVFKTSPNGWRQHMISELTAATDQPFIVFRGMVYTEQPTWLTLVAHLWSRFLRKLGLRHDTIPVIAVMAPAKCDVERLPWHELQ
jgi:hypothetical protein